MNRSAASATYYPFQVMPRFLFGRQGDVFYIGGSDILPPPLESQREARILASLWLSSGGGRMSLPPI